MSFLEGLQFRPGKSIVHRLDPRVKLLASILILTTTFIFVDALVITILLLMEAILIKIAKVERLWFKTLRGALPFAILVFILTLFTRSIDKGWVFLTFYDAFAYGYRIVIFLSSFSLFFLTTTPEEIALTLTKLRIPYHYIFAFVSAIRFTPVLAQEMKNIMDAQRARGLELDKGNFIQRTRKLIPILVPLLVNVLRRSYELAEAMEVKCFGAYKKRTYLKELSFTGRDYLFLAIVLALFSLAVYVRLMGVEPAKIILRGVGLL